MSAKIACASHKLRKNLEIEILQQFLLDELGSNYDFFKTTKSDFILRSWKIRSKRKKHLTTDSPSPQLAVKVYTLGFPLQLKKQKFRKLNIFSVDKKNINLCSISLLDLLFCTSF